MAERSGIEWTDATFNPWWGCERVSPACAHCYADNVAHRYAPGQSLWGRGHGFRFFSDAHWRLPLTLERKSARDGRRSYGGREDERIRVFCASMADVFEQRDELEPHRRRLFDLIEETPHLDWQILTKRPAFARDWLRRQYDCDCSAYGCQHDGVPPNNVWVGTSIENARFTWRADVLREIPAAVRFISAEPLLGSLFERRAVCGRCLHVEREVGLPPETCQRCDGRGFTRGPLDLSGIDWLIGGGESGVGARPMELEWVRELRDGCDAAGVAFFLKQLGGVRDKRGGEKALLDGRRHQELPLTASVNAASG